jgi:AcrR family transcriptional regulator
MTKRRGIRRRGEALSRERIIDASIELLDRDGEDGLTFRALSERLSTGPGAIYWHIANKGDLLSAACSALVARAMNEVVITTPDATIRALALDLFDLIDAHPWVGSALAGPPGALPVVHIVERIGQQIRALRVPEEQQWDAVGTLMAFILGVSSQNAARRHLARVQHSDRADFLDAVATAWSRLDASDYPFARSVAGRVRTHDDRADFLAGINLILAGIGQHPPSRAGC